MDDHLNRPHVEIIVRRGALRRFAAFRRKTSHLPVAVKWDRRVAEAPAPGNRQERRQPPPFTWQVADFVVVEPPCEGQADPGDDD